ncbi:MAG: peptide chain release factor N(5)-glutamine methyltransferase [Spirochaetaceae bacterium]|nr:MAG: peptide chain release factor N(5)-glutamine methyltransferase [Spirochaetaceae bacterium]
MTVRDVLKEATSDLVLAEVDSPSLDAVLLCAHALGVSKEKLFAMFQEEISDEEHSRILALLCRRGSGEPVSYIRNTKEFYGIDFFVDNRVLVPRPDTETLVNAARDFCRASPKRKRILDMCTGSGCVAIALAQLFPDCEISGSDASPGAGEVFKKNSRQILGKELPFIRSDLFSGISGKYDCIVSNPPYLTCAETDDMKKIGWPEPAMALDGGLDGTDILSQIISQSAGFLEKKGRLILEAAPGQMKKLYAILANQGYIDIEIIKDLAERQRVIAGSRP